MKNNKKNFINNVVLGGYFLFGIRIIVAGVFQAVVSYFTKKKLEEWEKNKD